MSIDVIINWQISERACWDFSSNITNGNATFSKAELTEGTVAIINCTKGELVGTNILNCIEGQWDQSLPNCSIVGKILTNTFMDGFKPWIFDCLKLFHVFNRFST